MNAIPVPHLWDIVEIGHRKGVNRPRLYRWPVLAVLSERPPQVDGWLVDHGLSPGFVWREARMARVDDPDDDVLRRYYPCLTATEARLTHLWRGVPVCAHCGVEGIPR